SLATADRAGVLKPVFEHATALATDKSASEAARVEAIRLIAMNSVVLSTLTDLLEPSASPATQSAVVEALLASPVSAANLFSRWGALSPQARTKAIGLLLTRRERASALLDAIEAGTVSRGHLSAADKARLANHADARLRSRAEQIFYRDASSRAQVIQRFRPALDLKGDAE